MGSSRTRDRTSVSCLAGQVLNHWTTKEAPRFSSWIGKISRRRKWQSAPVSCLGDPMDRGAWWAAVHGVACVCVCLCIQSLSRVWLILSDSKTPLPDAPLVSKEPSPGLPGLKGIGCMRRAFLGHGVRSWDHSSNIPEVAGLISAWLGWTSPGFHPSAFSSAGLLIRQCLFSLPLELSRESRNGHSLLATLEDLAEKGCWSVEMTMWPTAVVRAASGLVEESCLAEQTGFESQRMSQEELLCLWEGTWKHHRILVGLIVIFPILSLFQLTDLWRECHWDRFQQFYLHQERGRDHRGHRHDGWHWHRLLGSGGGQLPVTGRFRERAGLPLLDPPWILLRKPLYCNAKFERRTWMVCKEKFPANGLWEPSKDEWLGYFEMNFFSIASGSVSVASHWHVKFGGR